MKYLIPIILALIFIPLINAQQCNCSCINNETIKEEIELPENSCNIQLNLTTDKEYYKNGEKITINNILNNKSIDFDIEYWIENLNGSIIKNKTITKNTLAKQYTPKLDNNSTLVIKNNLTTLNCININNNTYNELKVFIEVEKEPNSNLTLKEIIPRNKKLKLGENLTINLKVYTGNISNYTITTEIENITNKTELILNKYNYTDLTILNKINENCNIIPNNYTLIINSNSSLIKDNITIINECVNQTANNAIILQNSTQNSSENLINQELNPITGHIVYESSNIKAKKIGVYTLVAILVTLIITFITKKSTLKQIKEQAQKWYSQ
ncbi:MAG TPA: hypothetical protein VJI68_03335 [Candidatus Nanoarchaeia archaeon]|nr:hypothetical protein [Candidatus Nanoarchaeia archaeon]